MVGMHSMLWDVDASSDPLMHTLVRLAGGFRVLSIAWSRKHLQPAASLEHEQEHELTPLPAPAPAPAPAPTPTPTSSHTCMKTFHSLHMHFTLLLQLHCTWLSQREGLPEQQEDCGRDNAAYEGPHELRQHHAA